MTDEKKATGDSEMTPAAGEGATAAAKTEATAEAAGTAAVEPAEAAAEAAPVEPAETVGETMSAEIMSDEDAGTAPPSSGPSPDEELAQLREETAKLRDQALRAMAEAENTRRRVSREKEDMARYAIAGFARDLLATADNLRRALDAVPDEARQADAVLAAMVDGVAASEKEMLSTFEKHGITKLDPFGEKFDPNYHQAMFEADGTGQVPGTVVQVLQAGYVLNGRLLRPAMVAVAKGEAPKKVDTVA